MSNMDLGRDKKREKKAYSGWRQGVDNSGFRSSNTASSKIEALANANGKNTNAVFASSDERFRKICSDAGIPATPKQAGKFRAKKGIAYLASMGYTIRKVKETFVPER